MKNKKRKGIMVMPNGMRVWVYRNGQVLPTAWRDQARVLANPRMYKR